MAPASPPAPGPGARDLAFLIRFLAPWKGRIAHRLATVKSAHRIVVMDQGRIVATGNHEQPVARHGLHARLAALQFASVPSAH